MAKKLSKKVKNDGLVKLDQIELLRELGKADRKITEIEDTISNDAKVLDKNASYLLWKTYKFQLESYISIPF